MSTDPLAHFWVHPVAIARFLGVDAYGRKTYAPLDDPLPKGWVDDERRLVRNDQGEQVTSETTVYLPKGTAGVPLGSLVTLPSAHGPREATVLAVSVHDGGGLDTPDHIELALT